MSNTVIKLFEDKKIRTIFNSDEEKWYFSIIDIIAVLTESKEPRNYWKWLKSKLKEEGSQLVSNTTQLKLEAADGKKYMTDVADFEQLFRLIQSIPSKKVEPLKMWLAEVGKDRIDETYDPEIAINRALDTYRKKGYSEEWINQRLKTIDVRKEFTDELQRSGINSSKDFAILTNILTQTWSGLSVKEYKNLKGLTKDNLRDNMTNMELILNMLAEASSTEISKATNPKSTKEVTSSVVKGATIAKNAKEQLEHETGNKIISDKNNKDNNRIASKDKIGIN